MLSKVMSKISLSSSSETVEKVDVAVVVNDVDAASGAVVPSKRFRSNNWKNESTLLLFVRVALLTHKVDADPAILVV